MTMSKTMSAVQGSFGLQTRKPGRARAGLLLAAVLSALGMSAARAATVEWSATATDGVWETGTNWTGGTAPGGDGDDQQWRYCAVR